VKKIMLALLLAVLCACKTGPQVKNQSVRQEASKWIGHTADELVAARGAPTNIYLLNSGGREFEYFQIFTRVMVKSRVPVDLDLTRDYVDPTKTRSDVYIREKSKEPLCVLIFEISAENVVKKWSLEGEKCVQ